MSKAPIKLPHAFVDCQLAYTNIQASVSNASNSCSNSCVISLQPDTICHTDILFLNKYQFQKIKLPANDDGVDRYVIDSNLPFNKRFKIEFLKIRNKLIRSYFEPMLDFYEFKTYKLCPNKITYFENQLHNKLCLTGRGVTKLIIILQYMTTQNQMSNNQTNAHKCYPFITNLCFQTLYDLVPELVWTLQVQTQVQTLHVQTQETTLFQQDKIVEESENILSSQQENEKEQDDFSLQLIEQEDNTRDNTLFKSPTPIVVATDSSNCVATSSSSIPLTTTTRTDPSSLFDEVEVSKIMTSLLSQPVSLSNPSCLFEDVCAENEGENEGENAIQPSGVLANVVHDVEMDSDRTETDESENESENESEDEFYGSRKTTSTEDQDVASLLLKLQETAPCNTIVPTPTQVNSDTAFSSLLSTATSIQQIHLTDTFLLPDNNQLKIKLIEITTPRYVAKYAVATSVLHSLLSLNRKNTFRFIQYLRKIPNINGNDIMLFSNNQFKLKRMFILSQNAVSAAISLYEMLHKDKPQRSNVAHDCLHFNFNHYIPYLKATVIPQLGVFSIGSPTQTPTPITPTPIITTFQPVIPIKKPRVILKSHFQLKHEKLGLERSIRSNNLDKLLPC